MDVASQRTFAANFGEVRRLGTRAFDILLAAEEGTAPYPPGMSLPDADASQPLSRITEMGDHFAKLMSSPPPI
jgi:hypothetical protein